MEECDTLIRIGTSFPYMEFFLNLGKPNAFRLRSTDFSSVRATEVDTALVGDAKTSYERCSSAGSKNNGS